MMEDIYNEGRETENSIVQIPDGYSDAAGNTLMSWMSSFWREVHSGSGMVKGLQQARGIRVAQMYLDMLEILKLQDRRGMPVFHRELWYPIVIRRSDRDKSQENMLRMGENGMQIGPQTPSSEYEEGSILHIGKLGNYEKYVTYPIRCGDDIVSVDANITDNVICPHVVLEAGTDFVIRNGSIIIPKESDPFGENTPFDIYNVPNDNSDDPEDIDAETVLWASNALIDRNYVADHLSYAMGVSAPSTAIAKRIVNAAWDAVNDGATPGTVREMLAAMLNIPSVRTEGEKVLDVTTDTDGTRKVRTTAATYSVYAKAKLKSGIVPGAVLSKNELLDESVRVYPYVTDPARTGDALGYSVPLEQDIPSVSMDSCMLRVRTEHGIYAMWNAVPVERDPVTGNPFFRMGGSEDDVRRFWEGVWSGCRAAGIDPSDVVGSYERGDMVRPAEFFLKNMVGANTMFVVVDRSQLEDVSMMRDPMFFDMLCRVVPSATRLFLVEHVTKTGDDWADLEDAEESVALSAGLKGVKEFNDVEERVATRFIRPAPKHVSWRKEEE